MSQHSPEPWQIAGCDDLVIDQLGYGVPMNFTNRRRIVACVNACAGIETSVIEQNANKVSDLLNQRDELLAALKKLLDSINSVCLCGRGESCSACSRSSNQRSAESEAKILIKKLEQSK